MAEPAMYDAAQSQQLGLMQQPTPHVPSASQHTPHKRSVKAESNSDIAKKEEVDEQEHSDDEAESDEDNKSRSAKRRKLSKDADKKYVCPHDGCDKRYSRAEHLYRHQLNHNPKQVYTCDYIGCGRRFVRQDLCARHKDRHKSRSSGQVRTTKSRYDLPVTFEHPPGIVNGGYKDAAARRDSTLAPPPVDMQDTPSSHTTGGRGKSSKGSKGSGSPVSARRPSNYQVPDMNSGLHVLADLGNGQHSQMQSYGNAGRPPRPLLAMDTGGTYAPTMPSRFGDDYATTHPQMDRQPASYPMSAYPTYNPYQQQSQPQTTQPRRNSTAFTPVYQNHGNNYMPYTSRTPSMSAPHPAPAASPYTPTYNQHPQPDLSSQSMGHQDLSHSGPLSENIFANAMHQPGQMNVPSYMQQNSNMPTFFPDDGPQNGQFGSMDDFNNWLFDPTPNFNGAAMISTDMANEDQWGYRNNTPLDYGHGRMDLSRTFSGGNSEQQTPVIASQPAPPLVQASEYHMPGAKREELINFIVQKFEDDQHEIVTRYRNEVLAGDHARFPHVLCTPMMEAYLRGFWNNVHPQLPILHRPTFTAQDCPNLLLLAMLALGSSNLDDTHDFHLRQKASDLSHFLAWHVRYRIYQHVDFGPPAKLWIFQALILLEIFEKMYSSRSLHERAHVHHATTITLIRRGSSLIGRYGQDFPPFSADNTSTPTGMNGQTDPFTADPEWNAWISIEATRRIAFAAFVIDTTHAHMFGHSAVMVAHEMRLALPCDEAMWAANNFAEVSNFRAKLETMEYKQVAFLEALKKTLNKQPVRTNTFGRVSIMAGLLSVSWHMKMQDVRSHSIGLGQRSEWRDMLLAAFDFWKEDFDNSLETLASLQPRSEKMGNKRLAASTDYEDLGRDNVFEARTVLHHLAHMAMHSDMLECMMFAGAKRLLGRVITNSDRVAVKRHIDNWAPTKVARDATFFALQFLRKALLPPIEARAEGRGGKLYNARDDVLLNRPWVLYLAAMVVWSYGFAVEGPLADGRVVLGLVGNVEAQVADMRRYLVRVGGAKNGEEMGERKGKNQLLGLFLLLRETFRQARWELLHEAEVMMGYCINELCPRVQWETERRDDGDTAEGRGGWTG